MEIVKFEISGMTCDSCATSIKELLKSKQGIVSGKVSYPEKKGEFTFNPEKISKDDIREIIDKETHYKVVGEIKMAEQIATERSLPEPDPDKTVILQSIITCPICGFQKEEIMPEDSCQFFYECEQCKTVLRPKAGDCCVYCSFGSIPCPSIQIKNNCC